MRKGFIMLKKLLILWLTLTAVIAYADSSIKLYDTIYYTALDGDVDGDGMIETYKLERFANSEFGDYYKLKLYRGGKLLWSAPSVDNGSDPFTFGVWDDGVSMLDIVIDIDGDGKAELLSMPPAGDVASIPVQIMRYDGKKVINTDEYLIMDYNNSNRLRWVKSHKYKSPMSNTNEGWASGFEKYDNNGTVKTYILYMLEDGDSRGGSALIRFVSDGAVVVKWLEPLDITRGNKSYIARISKKDLYNSRGHRLTKVIDILRQDRANYYKSVDETEDTGISRFRTLKQREDMSDMGIEPIGMSLREMSRIIQRENPLLHVKVNNSTLSVGVIRESRKR